MNFKKTLAFFIIHLSFSALAQLYTVKGKVTGTSIEPLPFVTVNVLDQVNTTVTNELGEFKLMLSEGHYTFVFSCLGYETYKQDVILKKANTTINVILKESNINLNEVEVSTKYIDPAKSVIQQVIKHKSKYVRVTYQTDLYIKVVETEYNSKKDTIDKTKTQRDSLRVVKNKKTSYKDSLKLTKKISHNDSIKWQKKNKIFVKDSLKKEPKEFAYEKLNMAEIVITKKFEYPDKLKEERIGYDVRGDATGLFYLSTTEGEFNFYQNAVYCPSISEMPFQSPLSTSGLLMYKFKTIKVFKEGNKKIYKIKVVPNLFSNSLVSGEIEIIDSLFCLRSFKFTFPKHQLSEYSSFEMTSEFVPYDDTLYRISKSIFDYIIGGAKKGSIGRTTVYYENFKYEKGFSKKTFGDEVSTTTPESYEKDSSFWKQIRKEPLSEKELKFIRIEDSIKTAHESKTYLDSIDKDENKITIQKIALFGQSRYNREKELRISFNPLWTCYQPVGVGGARLRYGVSLDKKFKNKKWLGASTILNYGILNRDLNGIVSVNRLYNPFKISIWGFDVGRNYDIVNASNTWAAVFRTANYYLNEHLSGYHTTELFNGFHWNIRVEYSTRKSISHIKNNGLTNLVLDNSTAQPIDFDFYDALYMSNSISYTPKQKYIREPYEKKILGSKYPTFTVTYRNGIPHVFKSAVNFDYLQYSISKDLDFRFFGISKIRIYSGKFYNTKSLKVIDYKYQPRVGFPFFADPLSSFQALEQSYVTLNRFYAGHYFHRFNGAFINKIPYAKFLKLTETVGGGFLRSRENDLMYVEVYAGMERSIRLFREIFRLGIYAVAGKTNHFLYNTGFRISIDQYDKLSNKWNY